MTEAEIRAAIEATPKGSNVYVVWERRLDLKKAYKGFPLFKRTKMLLRLGVDYDEMDDVKKARENGDLPAENAGMRGKEWVDFPTLKRSLKTGNLLLSVKLAKVYGKTVKKAETVYIVREAGKETVCKSEEGIAKYGHMMYAKRKGEMPNTFDLKIEDVISIHEHHGVEEAEAVEV
jgi:hypothetical protein